MRAVVLALGGLMLAESAVAQDVEAGRQVANMCRTCHGLDGYAQIPMAPHIGGEPAAYLVDQLRAFRSGAREHEMMSVVASTLSDQQIADVAAWYAAHEASAEPPANPDAAPMLCAGCHGIDGLSTVENAPNLAGEDAIYIETQLKAFRRGARQHEVMSSVAAELSDADIRAVSDWYARIEVTIEPPG